MDKPAFSLFFKGLSHSIIYLPSALITVFTSSNIFVKTSQILLLNGVLYFGSLYFYSWLPVNMVPLVLYKFFQVFFKFWILLVYLISLSLTTFWTQDIYDEASRQSVIDIARARNNSKLSEVFEKNYAQQVSRQIGAKQSSMSQIQRLLTITTYILLVELCYFVLWLVGINEIVVTVIYTFLYSFLNSFYLFEYKAVGLSFY